jgi:hypothetical protein
VTFGVRSEIGNKWIVSQNAAMKTEESLQKILERLLADSIYGIPVCYM